MKLSEGRFYLPSSETSLNLTVVSESVRTNALAGNRCNSGRVTVVKTRLDLYVLTSVYIRNAPFN